ncbi:MAG: hypothetical protein ISR48_05055 [Alphaproteobacteria bacterium]|nr:hypothetical protein [Alphaproteobacteria bacterium]
MKKLPLFSIIAAIGALALTGFAAPAWAEAPDLRGLWKGQNDTVSVKEGYRHREKSINITDQNGRRFKGTVDYSDGTNSFVGVLRGDNKTLIWADIGEDGHVFGTLLNPGVMEACYVNTGAAAVAGCAILIQQP